MYQQFFKTIEFMQATDKTSFEKYPRITSWIETCKADIPGKHKLKFNFLKILLYN